MDVLCDKPEQFTVGLEDEIIVCLFMQLAAPAVGNESYLLLV